MPTRPPALAAPLVGLLLVLAACSSPAPPSGPSAEPSPTEASVTTDATPMSPTPAEVEPAGSTPAEVEPAGSTEPGTEGSGIEPAPGSALAAALDAVVPGLGAAGDRPLTEVCGQLSVGSERWLVETVAAGEYAPYAAGGFIEPEDAARIVDLIEPTCG